VTVAVYIATNQSKELKQKTKKEVCVSGGVGVCLSVCRSVCLSVFCLCVCVSVCVAKKEVGESSKISNDSELCFFFRRPRSETPGIYGRETTGARRISAPRGAETLL
jgi:hypothetical protein